MGILDTLAGWTKVLQYRIVFGSDGTVGVHIGPWQPEIPGTEYVRLWASYEAKIIYNLGFPKNVSSLMALNSVSKVSEIDITADTDCFERADFADVIQFAHEVPASGTTFTGEFYAKGSLKRMIKAHSPIRGATEQQVVFSGLAFMQYAILVNRSDAGALDLLSKTSRNFVALYESGMGEGITSVAQVPYLAYMQAIGLYGEQSSGS